MPSHFLSTRKRRHNSLVNHSVAPYQVTQPSSVEHIQQPKLSSCCVAVSSFSSKTCSASLVELANTIPRDIGPGTEALIRTSAAGHAVLSQLHVQPCCSVLTLFIDSFWSSYLDVLGLFTPIKAYNWNGALQSILSSNQETQNKEKIKLGQHPSKPPYVYIPS